MSSPRPSLTTVLGARATLGMSGDIGAVKNGYVADLVLLDGGPLADINNTRRIWLVVQGGRPAFAAGAAGAR